MFKDLTGRRFGRLVVLEIADRDKNQKIKWLCRCDCGTKKSILGRHLVSGAVRSCNCLQREVARKNRLGKASVNRLPFGRSMRNRVLSQYKQQADKRGYSWELTDSQFEELSQQLCHYCGRPPIGCAKTKANNGEFVYNGIDRINNTQGYTSKNIVTCCKICNRCKSDMSYDEFIEYLVMAGHHLKNKDSHDS